MSKYKVVLMLFVTVAVMIIKKTYYQILNKKRKSVLKGPHLVQPGDTYWALARKYGTTVKKLRALNGYPDTKIPVGVELRIRENDKLSKNE